jgi:hypothetical protein
VRRLVNIDGFGPPPEGFSPPGVPIDRRPLPLRFADYLDRRRKAAERAWRPYPSLEDLVERRRAQNPRLSREWLRYFLHHGAREVPGGWVWKTDPDFAGGFGPWRPEWVGPGWKQLRMPMLAVVGTEPDSWRLAEAVAAERLAFVPEVERRRSTPATSSIWAAAARTADVRIPRAVIALRPRPWCAAPAPRAGSALACLHAVGLGSGLPRAASLAGRSSRSTSRATSSGPVRGQLPSNAGGRRARAALAHVRSAHLVGAGIAPWRSWREVAPTVPAARSAGAGLGRQRGSISSTQPRWTDFGAPSAIRGAQARARLSTSRLRGIRARRRGCCSPRATSAAAW